MAKPVPEGKRTALLPLALALESVDPNLALFQLIKKLIEQAREDQMLFYALLRLSRRLRRSGSRWHRDKYHRLGVPLLVTRRGLRPTLRETAGAAAYLLATRFIDNPWTFALLSEQIEKSAGITDALNQHSIGIRICWTNWRSSQPSLPRAACHFSTN